MSPSTVDLLHLPDEILLMITSKISYFDVLNSLVGVNKRLDRLACDSVHNRSIALTEKTSNDEIRSLSDQIFDRFCQNILPGIHQHIECLTIESSSIARLFYSTDYPKLFKLILPAVDLESVSCYFNEQMPFIRIFKEQISHLVVAVVDKSESISLDEMTANVYIPIFNLFKNVTHLEFVTKDNYQYPPLSIYELPSAVCFSSTIVHLSIRVFGLEDCLCLLDGRLNQLHTFIVRVYHIGPGTDTRLDNTTSLPKLKCFSLISLLRTRGYDNCVVPLLHRMFALEKLTLSLHVEDRTSFIDGIHLNNEIQSRMPYLSTFIFNIFTSNVHFSEDDQRPSSDDIRRTFIQGTSIDCYVDYDWREQGRCHIYSLPLPLTHLLGITNSFPGGLFIHVRVLYVIDPIRPFEHEFFERISRSFPLLSSLTVFNLLDQEQLHQCSNDEEVSSVVEYPHLTELDLQSAHIDYIEQFLINTRTYLPRLNVLRVEYELLATATENFTNNATRLNCANVKRLITEEIMVHSEDVHLYFPSL